MTNFAFVQSDFPMGGTGWDKTNWAAKTYKFPVLFSLRR